MGGFVAQALAARAPGRVESLALLSTDPGGPSAIRAEPADWDTFGPEEPQARGSPFQLMSRSFCSA